MESAKASIMNFTKGNKWLSKAKQRKVSLAEVPFGFMKTAGFRKADCAFKAKKKEIGRSTTTMVSLKQKVVTFMIANKRIGSIGSVTELKTPLRFKDNKISHQPRPQETCP